MGGGSGGEFLGGVGVCCNDGDLLGSVGGEGSTSGGEVLGGSGDEDGGEVCGCGGGEEEEEVEEEEEEEECGGGGGCSGGDVRGVVFPDSGSRNSGSNCGVGVAESSAEKVSGGAIILERSSSDSSCDKREMVSAGGSYVRRETK